MDSLIWFTTSPDLLGFWLAVFMFPFLGAMYRLGTMYSHDPDEGDDE